MNTELIEKLEGVIQALGSLDVSRGWNTLEGRTAVADAIDALRAQEWVDVNERLPEKTGYYLGFVGGAACSLWYIGDGVWRAIEVPVEIIVTHWMPLPAPPHE